jgi:hypothetical protein
MSDDSTIPLTLGIITIMCSVVAITLVLTKPGSSSQSLTVQTTNTIETTN